MLLDRFFKQNTLYLVIENKHVEAAVYADGGWIASSLVRISLDIGEHALPEAALFTALDKLRTQVASWQAENRIIKLTDSRIVVSDSWLPSISLVWNGAAMHQSAKLEQYARNQFMNAGFEIGSSDALRFYDRAYGEPRIAVAYPAALLSILEILAEDLGLHLSSILPLSATSWNAQKDVTPVALAIIMENSVLFLEGRSELEETKIRPAFPADIPALKQALSAEWERIKLRNGIYTAEQKLQVINLIDNDAINAELASNTYALTLSTHQTPLGGIVPGIFTLALNARSSVYAIDAITDPFRIKPAMWPVLITALFFVGVSLLQTLHVNQEAAALFAGQTEVHAQPRVVSTDDWSSKDIARINAVNATIRQINLPISALINALQPPKDIRVAVLSFDVTGAAGAAGNQGAIIKIMAEAPTGTEMAQYISFLSESRPFTRAYLTHHEIVDSASEHPYRFTAEALWKE